MTKGYSNAKDCGKAKRHNNIITKPNSKWSDNNLIKWGNIIADNNNIKGDSNERLGVEYNDKNILDFNSNIITQQISISSEKIDKCIINKFLENNLSLNISNSIIFYDQLLVTIQTDSEEESPSEMKMFDDALFGQELDILFNSEQPSEMNGDFEYALSEHDYIFSQLRTPSIQELFKNLNENPIAKI